MITDYAFDKTESPGAKQIINFSDEMHFNIRATGKSNRDRTLINNHYNKEKHISIWVENRFPFRKS